MKRIQTEGKFFSDGGGRFRFRGVTYGTFAPRPLDAARFPELHVMKQDLHAMRDAEFTVVRTYTEPPQDLLEVAEAAELRVMAGVHFDDWRYLIGSGRRQMRSVARDAELVVRSAAERLAENPTVLGICLGNEIPADVLRWFGEDKIASILSRLAQTVREVDPKLLVTYANYPSAEYLDLEDLDFLTFNVFLEQQLPFRKYLTRLHNLAGDRPLVLGEMGLHSEGTAEGEKRQADTIDWQLETAIERGVAGTCLFSWTDDWVVGDNRVEGWYFGLTDLHRKPKRALEVAKWWNTRGVEHLDYPWPRISVVICAYNEEAYIDECLRHSCALEYPDFEVLLIDDGSTDRTVEIARAHPDVVVHQLDHGGLSTARNEGYRRATGSVVAYLDADAFPSPEWLRFLALGFDGRTVGGVGGPNIPPESDGPGAKVVAQSPGGPVHVLLSDDRAEHIPGCNMAFYRKVLIEVGGCDPVYTSAGDDVDLCWRILDRDWQIGFHPAALVWHHRRTGLRAYLKQQRGYGRSEALVETRHPERFTASGTARWRGHIYNSMAPIVTKQRVYRGQFGVGAYQSVYRGGGHMLDLLHQIGVPLAFLLMLSAPAAAASPLLGLPALSGIVFLLAMFIVDFTNAAPGHDPGMSRMRFRLLVATHHVLQPPVRTWGRSRARAEARWKDVPVSVRMPEVCRSEGRVRVVEAVESRGVLVERAVQILRESGYRIRIDSGWERDDAEILGRFLTRGFLQTSEHPEGFIQFRTRSTVSARWGVAFGCAAVGILWVNLVLGLFTVAILALVVLAESRRTRSVLDRVLFTESSDEDDDDDDRFDFADSDGPGEAVTIDLTVPETSQGVPLVHRVDRTTL